MIFSITKEQLPFGWKIKPFPQFVLLQRGKDLTKSNFKTGSVPVAGSSGIIGYHDVSFVRAPGITVGRSGSCGQVFFYNENFWAHNTSLYVKDFFGNDELFSFFYLQYLDVGRFKTGVSVPTLDRNSLNNLDVAIPPLDEQQKIASILNKVQGAIEKQEAIIRTTTEIKKALLQKLFTEGLHGEPQKETEVGLVPESWNVRRIVDVAKVGNGSTPKRDNESYWKEGNTPWLNSTKIHEFIINSADQFVSELAEKECHLPLVKPSSLLIAITGQGKTLGNTAIVTFPTTINQHLAYIEFNDSEIHPKFVLWFLQTRYQHLRSIAQAGGSTKGALTCSFIKSYFIPLPTLAEQKRISKILDVLYSKEVFHEKKKQTLSSLFKTLLHQLMTGEVRVDEIDFQQTAKEYSLKEQPLTVAAEP